MSFSAQKSKNATRNPNIFRLKGKFILYYKIFYYLREKPHHTYMVFFHTFTLQKEPYTPMRLYIFNPDTDIAESAHSRFYTPPASVVKMKHDLAMLPVWYGDGGTVLTPHPLPDKLAELASTLGTTTKALPDDGHFDYSTVTEVSPWGWNSQLAQQMLEAGVPEQSLPDSGFLASCRAQASRGKSIEILQHLRQCPLTCGERFMLHSAEQAAALPHLAEGWIAKELWSGSGKGLCRFNTPPAPDKLGRMQRWIRKHGGATCEPFYDKVEDFAMEFVRDASGKVSFWGYSLFKTDSKGAYDYNLLLDDEAIESHLSQYVGRDTLQHIAKCSEECLTTALTGGYTGFLGLDMMICRESGTGRHAVHPCVEMNLRMNMGVLAGMVYRRYVVPGHKGKIGIIRFPEKGHMKIWSNALEDTAPAAFEGGRLARGGMMLTPVTDDALFGLFCLVK